MWRKIIIVLLAGVLLGGSLAYYRTVDMVYVPVLVYHKIGNDRNPMSLRPEEFEHQLSYLQSEGYTTVTLDEVAAFIQNSDVLPPKPLVITFDDGYADNYHVAVPLLRKYGFKAIIFVITDNIGKPGYLTWQQLKAVQERAISVGSHTMTHADLTKLSPAEIDKEVRISKISLEMGLGTATEYIAYPNGAYNQAVISAIRAAGYKGGCDSSVGVNTSRSNLYGLHRIYIGPSRGLGLWGFKLRMLRARLFAAF